MRISIIYVRINIISEQFYFDAERKWFLSLTYIKLLGKSWIKLVMHRKQFFRNKLKIGGRAISQHYQHFICC